MMEEEIKIIDNSGDKEYFTIVPNFILNHSTADEQALYLQMKRFAGESGECFATQETLGKKLGWERKKTGLIIKLLLKRKWIKETGTKVLTTSPVKTYEIIDLWDLNNKFYQKKRRVQRTRLSDNPKRGESKGLVRGESKTPLEEELNIKNSSKEGNQVAILRTYFIESVKREKNFEPEMVFGKEGKLLKDKLKRYTVEQLKDLMDKYLNSEFGAKSGYSLSVCLSSFVINQWLNKSLEKPKKPFFRDNPMCKMQDKWKVLENGQWLEFAGKESEIVFK